MSGQWRRVVQLHFVGGRYDDPALDATALREIQRFQKMVADTATALWRKRNPNRSRMPRGFPDRTRLCLRGIEAGSTVAPFDIRIDEPEQQQLFEPEQELSHEAVELLYRVFQSANTRALLPEECPKQLVADYAELGKGLSGDEVLKFAPPEKPCVCVTEQERRYLSHWSESSYEDSVDVIGHVLEVDVKKKRFEIWVDEKPKITVEFSAHQESEVTTALKEHAVTRLRIRGRGEFTKTGMLRKITQVKSLTCVHNTQPTFDATAPRIEDVIADIVKDVSDEEWEEVPDDLSHRHDFYLYGEGSR